MNHTTFKKLIAAGLFALATPAAAQVIVPIIPNNVPIVPPVWLPGPQIPVRTIPNPVLPSPTGPVSFPTAVALPSVAAAPKPVALPAPVAAPVLPGAIQLPSPLRQAREKGLPVDSKVLTAMFDGVKAQSEPAASPVDPYDNPELERAPDFPSYERSDRQVTVPEWELEQDLGIR